MKIAYDKAESERMGNRLSEALEDVTVLDGEVDAEEGGGWEFTVFGLLSESDDASDLGMAYQIPNHSTDEEIYLQPEKKKKKINK
jgi:hypothetical protein